MNDQVLPAYPATDSTHGRRPNGRIPWPFAVICCGYFLFAGWAAFKMIPIFVTLFAARGLQTPLLALVLSNYVWVIPVIIAGAVGLTLAKQFVNFRDRYRRLGNLFLVIVAIGFLPMVALATALVLFRPVFGIYGKLSP